MKRHRNSVATTAAIVLTASLILASVTSVSAAKIKLSNGTTFNGKLVSQNYTYVILEIGGTKVSIAKRMIVSSEGLPPGTTITNPDSPAPAPAPVPPPPKAVTQPVLPIQAPPTAESATAATQAKPVEITLKNGAKFKGVIVSETENLITLQNETGARVNIYKNIIANIPGRQLSAPAAPAPQPVVTAPAPPAPAPQQSPVAPAHAATTLPPAQQQPPAPAPAVTPVVTTVVPTAAPVIPVSTPPAAPVPLPVPAPATAVQTPPPPVIAPVKRADGRHELLLKNGTVFIGSIVSENDRFLSFGTSEGTTINILKRLIRKLDGVPYVVHTAAASPIDTSSQLKRTPPAGATGEKTAAAPATDAKPTAMKRRQEPTITLKPGVSMAELMDSLKSTFQDQRAVSARQIGTMGQWAAGAIGALGAMLGDTAGARELPPIETDSVSLDKMLPPGFEAARALARMGPGGIDELKRGTRSANPLVRQRAVFGFSEIQETGQIPTFQAALKDDDPRVRTMAVRGFRLNENSDALVNALNDLDGDVRTFAASALGDARSPAAVKALTVALRDVRPSVRSQSALSLARIGAKEAIAHISALIDDIEPPVRENAVVALGMLKDTASTAPLLVAMTDPNPQVRAASAKSLASLYDPRAIPSLYTAMQEKNDTVRIAVETAIKQLTEITLLIAALDNKNSLVRENVAYILWLMTGKEFGQDKKAWTEWHAAQGKAPKKAEAGKPEEKKPEEKKAEEKKQK